MKKTKNKKIALIFGTRPEIIKLSPLMRLLRTKKIPYFMIHTGQHYSPEMDSVFFKQLELPAPKYMLKTKSKGGCYQGEQTAKMVIAIEEVLIKEKPSAVLVQGDTNSVLAGALTASKLSTTRRSSGIDIKVGHIEAGLRSGDREMPEEINRVLADHASDHLFAPTLQAKQNLRKEGISASKIHITGNTIVDAVYDNLKLARKKSDVSGLIKEFDRGYILVTLHRQENVDVKSRLRAMLGGIESVAASSGLGVIFSVHPRTRSKIEAFGIKLSERVKVIQPVGFLDFLNLESQAALIMTDSGGLQEEGCILGVPCVTLRTTTERPETIKAGSNILAGIEKKSIIVAAEKMLKKKRDSWKNPFGNGTASRQILSITLGVKV